MISTGHGRADSHAGTFALLERAPHTAAASTASDQYVGDGSTKPGQAPKCRPD